MSFEAIIAAVGGLIFLLTAAFMRGGSRARRKAREQELRDYEQTRRRMDEADMGDDPAAARRWLRDRQQNGDM